MGNAGSMASKGIVSGAILSRHRGMDSFGCRRGRPVLWAVRPVNGCLFISLHGIFDFFRSLGRTGNKRPMQHIYL